MVKLILDHPGADLKAMDNVSQTALHHVCFGQAINPVILRKMMTFPDNEELR